MSAEKALAQATGLEDVLRSSGLAELLPLLEPLVQELNRRCGLLFAVDPGDTSAAAFETFWAAWCGAGLPRTGKAGARAAWKAKRRELPPLVDLLAAVQAYAASPRVRGGTVRNPETWIRKGCWTDDARTLTAIGNDAQRERRLLSELRAPGEGDQPPAFDVVARLRRLADASNGFRERVLALRADPLLQDVEALEERLSQLDRLMIAEAAAHLPPGALASIEDSARCTIAKLRRERGLPEAEARRSEEALRVQMVRARAGLPVLSLYSPEAEG